MSTANATVELPCATISTANQIQISAGTRNVTLHGCALRGASNASGSQGGTVFLYSGTGSMIQVGDPTYATDTLGFHIDNVVINTTASTSATAHGLVAYRTQEMDLRSLYFLGNSNQTGMTLDGTGNYSGGTFEDLEFGGFGTAVNAIGHQVSNLACNGLGKCEHVSAAAHRLSHKWRKPDCGYLWDQLTTGGREHLYRRRCRRMLNSSAPGTQCTEQHDCGLAERELEPAGGGRRGQFLQQLDYRRHDVHRAVDRQRHAQQLPRYISPEFQRIEW